MFKLFVSLRIVWMIVWLLVFFLSLLIKEWLILSLLIGSFFRYISELKFVLKLLIDMVIFIVWSLLSNIEMVFKFFINMFLVNLIDKFELGSWWFFNVFLIWFSSVKFDIWWLEILMVNLMFKLEVFNVFIVL